MPTDDRHAAQERLYRSLAIGMGQRFRARRWDAMLELFPDMHQLNVIDLGGELGTWDDAPVRPRHLTLLNPVIPDIDEARFRAIPGDACDPPPEVTSRSYDLVVSNSALEHVGGYHRRRQFAQTVATLAPRHWVQTPARSFPIEPHWLFPGFQWLPLRLRQAISRLWPIGFPRPREEPALTRDVLEIDLVSFPELRHLFPDSGIRRERFLGLTKSIIAVSS